MSLLGNKYVLVIGSEITLRNAITIRPKNKPAAALDQVEQLTNLSDLAAALGWIARSKASLLDTLTVLVGHPYVNYLVLQWQDEILTPLDRLIYAESMLEQQYGIARTARYCEIVQPRFGRAAIAASVQRDIVDEITAICQSKKLRLSGMRTLLEETIRSDSGKRSDDAVFVAQQKDADAFAFRSDGQWQQAFTLQGIAQNAEQRLLTAQVMALHFPANKYVTQFDAEEIPADRINDAVE